MFILLRKLGLLLALLVGLFLLIGYLFTYRYPPLSFDPKPLPRFIEQKQFIISAQGAYLKTSSGPLFRAYQPNVSVEIKATEDASIQFSIENIHPDASFTVSDPALAVQAQARGLRRDIQLQLTQAVNITLNFTLPEKSSYRFGATGDTGGDKELSWALERLGEQNVDFILHLGDVYYHSEEVGQVHQRMNQATVPVYTTNGNHDYNGPDGNVIDTYLRNIGPLNNAFRLLNSCFLNIETGNYLFPASKGERGKFVREQLASFENENQDCQAIIFTHKPIMDGLDVNIPELDHTLSGYDSAWLIKQIQQMPKPVVLAGHIHQDFEFAQNGVQTLVTGSGLAQADLVADKPIAKLLIGEISLDQDLVTSWINNAMPLDYHCSKKVHKSLNKAATNNDEPKEKEKYKNLVTSLEQACGH